MMSCYGQPADNTALLETVIPRSLGKDTGHAKSKFCGNIADNDDEDSAGLRRGRLDICTVDAGMTTSGNGRDIT
jgi:hypothetical protein